MIEYKKLSAYKFKKLTKLKQKYTYNEHTGIFTEIKTRKIAGCINSAGYNVLKIGRYYIPVHQLAWFFKYSQIPTLIDHINHYRLDCRLVNLKASNIKENNKNKLRAKNNTSGVTGVHLIKDSIDRYNVTIGSEGQIGTNLILSEAIALRKKAEKEHNYSSTHGSDLIKIDKFKSIQKITPGWVAIIHYQYDKIVRRKTYTRKKHINFHKYLGIYKTKNQALKVYNIELNIRQNFMHKTNVKQTNIS